MTTIIRRRKPKNTSAQKITFKASEKHSVKVSLQMYYNKFPTGILVRGKPNNLKQLHGIYINPYESKSDIGLMPLTPASVYHIRRVFSDASIDVAVNQWLEKEVMYRKLLESNTKHPPKDSENLYEHQHSGVAFIDSTRMISGNSGNMRVLLADDPRLGKTIQSIKSIKDGDYPVFVLCLKSLINHWADEFNKWSDADVFVLNGTVSERYKQAVDLSIRRNAVVITNWQFLHGVSEDRLSKLGRMYTTAIGDEAHVLKNIHSKLHKGMSKFRTANLLLLTATPTERGVQEYHPYLKLLRPAEFLSFWKFATQFTKLKQGKYGVEIGVAKNKPLLKDLLLPIVLRRTAEGTVTVPKKVYKDIRIDATPVFEKTYKKILEEITMEIAGQQMHMPNALVKLTRLKQYSSFPAMLGFEGIEAPKLDVLTDLLRNSTQENKFVVYAAYRDTIWYIKKHFRKIGIKVLEYTGSPSELRTFENGTGTMYCKALITTPELGGVGLDLSYARTIIFYDLPWSSIVYRQAIERTTKINHTEPRHIITLLTSKVDFYVAELLRKKLGDIRDSEVVENIMRISKEYLAGSNL